MTYDDYGLEHMVRVAARRAGCTALAIAAAAVTTQRLVAVEAQCRCCAAQRRCSSGVRRPWQ
jgi:predicted RNA methylase